MDRADRGGSRIYGEVVTLPFDKMPPHLRLPGNTDQRWSIDTNRIREELGYAEPIAQAEAIRRTIEWEGSKPGSGPHAFNYEAEDEALNGVATSA
jgi:nucleoside-diphosphate-sugar epimerase